MSRILRIASAIVGPVILHVRDRAYVGRSNGFCGGGTPHADAFEEASAPVLTPRQAKGLEFDHVVVVEPAAIAEDGEQGLRELYVALTRPTKTLVIVYARPLPDGIGGDARR